MLKIISKINCPRCESVKKFLDDLGVIYETEMAEDKGYGYWRDLVTEKTGELGFPIVFNGEDCINGSSENIINKITEWVKVTGAEETSKEDPNEHVTFAWGRNKHGETLKYLSVFIECLDCAHVCLNDDDSVCLKCGSKHTKRYLSNDPVFKKKY